MKQDPFSGVYRALSPKELAEMFMNPNAPKTEAEHWAVREIEKQRAEIERLRAQMQEIRERLYLAAGHAAAAALLSEEAHRKALEGKP